MFYATRFSLFSLLFLSLLQIAPLELNAQCGLFSRFQARRQCCPVAACPRVTCSPRMCCPVNRCRTFQAPRFCQPAPCATACAPVAQCPSPCGFQNGMVYSAPMIYQGGVPMQMSPMQMSPMVFPYAIRRSGNLNEDCAALRQACMDDRTQCNGNGTKIEEKCNCLYDACINMEIPVCFCD